MGTTARLIKKTGPIRNLLYRRVPFRNRYGKWYGIVLDQINRTAWDRGELELHQALHRMQVEAWASETAYYQHWDGTPTTKLDVRRFGASMRRVSGANVLRPYDGKHLGPVVTIKTSGSTGEPLEMWAPESIYHVEAAFLRRAYEAHGVRLFDEPVAWLRRYAPKDGDPLFRWDRELNRLYMSPYHMSRATVGAYVHQINKSQARCISGYPSSLYILASLMRDEGLVLPGVQSCHAASEYMSPAWRRVIEDVIGPVYEHYGLMEKTNFAFQCGYGQWHEASDYGYTGYGVTDRVGVYKVYGTGFYNAVQPLLKYDTGDLARLYTESRPPCPCGRVLPNNIIGYEGRSDDILELPDGRRIPPVNLYSLMYRVDGVRMFRLVQDGGDIQVDVIPDAGADGARVVRDVQHALVSRLGGDGVHVGVALATDIPRSTKTGKVKCIERL